MTAQQQMEQWAREAIERAGKVMLSGLRTSVAKQRTWDREIERRERIHRERAMGL
jgi:hypothetical protein